MRSLILLLTLVAMTTQAAPPKSDAPSARQSTKKVAKNPNTNLSTEHVFDGSAIDGRYKYADETAAVVENEKNVDDLLGVRLNFRDRRQQEQKRK
jgi:hypothetical protein